MNISESPKSSVSLYADEVVSSLTTESSRLEMFFPSIILFIAKLSVLSPYLVNIAQIVSQSLVQNPRVTCVPESELFSSEKSYIAHQHIGHILHLKKQNKTKQKNNNKKNSETQRNVP